MAQAQEARNITSDETIRILQEKAAKDGDEFTIKVLRRPHLSIPPQLMATLTGAHIEHFTSPELWVIDLCGGGKYWLQGFHASDSTKQIGGYVQFSADGKDPRDVDIDSVKTPGWRGPPVLEYPKKEQPRQPSEFSLYDVRSPPAPGSGDSAQKQPAWAGQAGGGIHRAQYGVEDPNNNWQVQARALESERRAIEKDRLEAERERHRTEIESLKRSYDSEIKSVEARFDSKFAALSAKPTGPDPMLEFMKLQADERRAADARAADDRRAAEARAAEDRKDQRDQQRKADERFMLMFEKISDRKERDPLDMIKSVSEIISKKSDGNDMASKSIHNMVEMQSTMMGVAMDFVDHASRLQLGAGGGSDEPGWVKGVDRVLKGIGAMAKAQAARAPIPAPMPQAAPQQMQGIPAGGVPQPVPPHAGAAPGSYATQPAAPPQAPPHEPTIVEQLEVAIRQHRDVREVAAALLTRLNDPSVKEALMDAGGDFELAVNKRLGSWANESPANAAYLKSLFAEVESQLEKAGQFEDDPSPAADGDEDDEEDAETDEDAAADEGDDE